MSKYKAYHGKILRINLSKREIRKQLLSDLLIEEYLGGRGWAAKILYDELKPKTDPLGEENKLVLIPGMFAATGVPVVSRFVAAGKSPSTGTFCISTGGGYFAPEVRRAGYDGIIIEGKASAPVYLWIQDNSVEIKCAKHLWGMLTDVTQESIRKETREDKVKIACIGPAGENLVSCAGIFTDRRAAGRGGLGAVMGSKNLKAITVQGTGDIEVADPAQLKQLIQAIYKILAGPMMNDFIEYGTPGTLNQLNELGILPTRNWQTGVFEGHEKISAEALMKYITKKVGCQSCPVPCGHISEVREGPYTGASTEGPEYETLYSLGSNCGNSNLESIICADMLCDRYGLDSISTGCTIAFVMECFEKGIIGMGDTGGAEVKFGNHRIIAEMIPKIASREGLGDFLAQGVKRISEKIGKESAKFAMHVKGLELGGYDPRGVQGQGVSMATSCRGGCHGKGGYMVAFEAFMGAVDRFATSGKGELIKMARLRSIQGDTLNLCAHGARAIRTDLRLKLISAVFGLDLTEKELTLICERIDNVERAFNVREGFTRKDDTLPWRLLNEPMPDGPAKGKVASIENNLNEFYEISGWDKATGIPTRAKLESLGLRYIADELDKT